MADKLPTNTNNDEQFIKTITTTTTQENEILDPSKNSKCELEEHCEAVRAPHIPDGHTFLVSTVSTETETVTTTKTTQTETEKAIELKAVPVITSTKTEFKINEIPTSTNELPCCSKEIVPISSSLPSKLLRFHAKRSAQALLHQVDSQDSQFNSDDSQTEQSDEATNDCVEIFDNIQTPTAPPAMSPVPELPPLRSPINSSEERLVDVGMGSSIEGSEESEEDDELKPLAVDNHVLHNVDLSSPISQSEVNAGSPHSFMSNSPTSLPSSISMPQELSEANLEKFRKHQHHHQQHQHQHHQLSPQHSILDNIYLHPNFKHDYLPQPADDKDISEQSPPPAVAPANSPIQERRVHRSFLTMKKEDAIVPTHATASTNTELSQDDLDSTINEVDTLDPSLIPSDDLAAEIAEAVEFYFSNDSILKDAFLLKHVRRNKEGFVSLKLVSSFKRVRQLTKDWRVVGNAVRRKSRKIELNELCTKVRRIDPLPNFDETMPSRTIVACDLPLDKLTIEKVSDIFSKCGEIALIRILKPGMAIPVDVRQFMNKYPEMIQKECALVEYLESSSAREAKNLQGPFQVFEMVAPKKKTGKKAIIQVAAPVARMVENYRYYNDASYERTRGGSFSGVTQQDYGDLRFKLKRNNSDFHQRNFGADNHHHQHQQQHHQGYNQAHHQPTHGGHYHQHQHQAPNQHNNHHYQHHRGNYAEHTPSAFQHYQPRGSLSHDATEQSSTGNFFAYSPRRYSNTSTISANTAAALAENAASTAPTSTTATAANVNNSSTGSGSYAHVASQNSTRRLSNCSDTYTSYTDMSRRASNCSEHAPQRRDSNCSESCPCSRRVSDFAQTETPYRKNSQCSIHSNNGERRFSNGSMQFERTFSTGSNDGFTRRMSNDFNYERKPTSNIEHHQTSQTNYDDGNVGGGGGGYNVFPRRYSNNFNVSSKLAAYDNAQYINGRRISTDSGYDRRCSFGSEFEGSPRSRTGSFLNNYKHGMDIDGSPRSRTNSFLDGSPRSRSGSLAQRNAENLVRTPLGPDGSKGFGSRARKFGQTVSPV